MQETQIILKPDNFIPYTSVPNSFIDYIMPKCNGEFIKVYLLLLRYIGEGAKPFLLSTMADATMMTESDVLRALRFLQNEGIVRLSFDGQQLREVHLLSPASSPELPDPTKASSSEPTYTPGSTTTMDTVEENASRPYMNANNGNHLRVVGSKPNYSVDEIEDMSCQDDMQLLLYIVQKYLGRTLKSDDIQTVISFNHWLGLPVEVIELLIEYCADNNHRNMRYIEKVALDWAENNINTPDKAKHRIETFNKSYFRILKAYGISDRTPTPPEIKMMDHWIDELRMDISLIEEACYRTIQAINKAQMSYTNAILENWFKSGIRETSDIDKLDTVRPPAPTKKSGQSQPQQANRFANYNQRQYDYEALEKKALELRLKETDEKRYSS